MQKIFCSVFLIISKGFTMQVNFTGIKNIGYENRFYTKSSVGYEDESDYEKDFQEREQEHFINLELTDDVYGKDLTEYKNIIKTTDLRSYTNPVNPKFLNLMISKDELADNLGTKKSYQLWINDSENEFAVTDSNLKMLSYIAKLLRRISATPDGQFKVNNDYIDSDDAKYGIILGENLEETYGDNYDTAIRNIHNPENVKNGAENMNNLLKEIMMDYFA